MREGSRWKYLTYAAGEVLIVIVGILVALQVNNWNDERQKDHDLDDLMVNLENELKSNSSAAQEIAQWGLICDTVFYTFISGELSEKEWGNRPHLQNIGVTYAPYAPQQHQLNRTLSISDDWPENYEGLLNDLRSYQDQLALCTELAGTTKSIVLDNVEFMRDEYPESFRQDSVSQAQMTKMMSSDSLWFNRVYYYHVIAMRNFASVNTQIEITEVDLLLQMAELDGEISGNQHAELLMDLGWIELSPGPCAPIEPSAFTTTLPLPGYVLNCGTDTLHVQMGDDANSRFALAPEQARPLTTLFDSVVKIFDGNGTCLEQYRSQAQGMIVLN